MKTTYYRMVHLTQIVRGAVKNYRRRKYRGFVDSIQLCVRGGAGGMGAPKYGGIGGSGGDVIFESKEDVSLFNIRRKYQLSLITAASGSNSCETMIRGFPGRDKIVEVPAGLTIIDENGQIIGELNEPNMKMIVAKGGSGGCPETGFSGHPGENRRIQLDIKLIADIGLVGFPNAGKSTLLKAITGAKPKIASYPFTTINPNVGVMQYEDLRSISMADLPGLIEGAHKNIGMGHQFLRHCERTKMLLLVVDIQGFRLSHKYHSRSCLETVILLNKELELYREYLLRKPALLLVNKMDTEGAWDQFKSIEKSLLNLQEVLHEFPEEIKPYQSLKFDEVIPVSIKYNPENVKNLKKKLRKYIDLYAEEGLFDSEGKLVNELQRKMLETGNKYA